MAPASGVPVAKTKMISVPMPQAQADKQIAKVQQPLGRHYNGQGYAATLAYYSHPCMHLWPAHSANACRMAG